MNIVNELHKIDKIEIGFDVSLAKEKLKLLFQLFNYLECNYAKISKDEIELFLQRVYGISLEIGNLKQNIEPRDDIKLMKLIMPMARGIFGETKEILPYLYTMLHFSINNEKEYLSVKKEIEQIEQRIIY